MPGGGSRLCRLTAAAFPPHPPGPAAPATAPAPPRTWHDKRSRTGPPGGRDSLEAHPPRHPALQIVLQQQRRRRCRGHLGVLHAARELRPEGNPLGGDHVGQSSHAVQVQHRANAGRPARPQGGHWTMRIVNPAFDAKPTTHDAYPVGEHQPRPGEPDEQRQRHHAEQRLVAQHAKDKKCHDANQKPAATRREHALSRNGSINAFQDRHRVEKFLHHVATCLPSTSASGRTISRWPSTPGPRPARPRA